MPGLPGEEGDLPARRDGVDEGGDLRLLRGGDENAHCARGEQGTPLAGRSLRDVGVAPYDIVKVVTETAGVYVRLDKDRAAAMDWK